MQFNSDLQQLKVSKAGQNVLDFLEKNFNMHGLNDNAAIFWCVLDVSVGYMFYLVFL